MASIKIIFCSQDPGGCNYLIPVIKKAFSKPDKYNVLCFMSLFSKSILTQNNLSFVDTDGLSDSEIKDKLISFSPDIIISSTSQGFSLEKKLIRFAKEEEINVPVITGIDYWSNYWLRFINVDELKEEQYLPNKILVIDEFMEKEMLTEGFPAKKILIVGNPAWEIAGNPAGEILDTSLNTSSDASSDASSDTSIARNKDHLNQRASGRKENHESLKILFLSQPIKALNETKVHTIFGYDEFVALKDLLHTLAEIYSEDKPFLLKSIYLKIKLHPKENFTKFDHLFREIIVPKGIIISQDSESDLDQLLADYPIIVGMNSAALFLASLKGKIVISYQPKLDPSQDPLVSNRLRLSKLVTSKSELKQIISSLLLDKILLDKKAGSYNKKTIEKYTQSRATDKILALVEEITK